MPFIISGVFSLSPNIMEDPLCKKEWGGGGREGGKRGEKDYVSYFSLSKKKGEGLEPAPSPGWSPGAVSVNYT